MDTIAQTPVFDAFDLFRHNSGYRVTCILQDHNGYIWFGTTNGLVRHDGIDFVEFPIDDSLYGNHITALAEDSEGALWIGHKNGGITLFQHGNLQKFDPESGLGSMEISAMFFDSDSILWFSTLGEGVYSYSGEVKKRLHNYMKDDGLADDYAYCFTQDADRNLYIGTDNGISVYNHKLRKFSERISMQDGLPDNIVKDISYRENSLIIGMEEGGICRFHLDNKSFETFGTWSFGSINNFTCLNASDCWVSTKRNGIIRLSLNTDNSPQYQTMTTREGLKSIETSCVFGDREKNIWVGAKGSIAKRSGNYFEFLKSTAELPLTNVYSLLVDSGKNIWATTSEGVIKISKNTEGDYTKKIVLNSASLAGNSFISIYEDHAGEIWVGTYGSGVFTINPITYKSKNYNSKNSPLNDNVIHISGKGDKIWFSTLGGGTFSYDILTGKFNSYGTDQGLSSNYVYSTFIDSKDNVWFAPDGGSIGILTAENSLIPLAFINTKYSRTTYDINEGPSGKIWFISSDQGLYSVENKKLVNINDSHGLKSNEIKSFSILNNGTLLLTFNQGIDLYSPKDSLVTHFGENFKLTDFSPALNSIFRDKEGNIWMGYNSGILKYTPEHDTLAQVNPTLILTEKQLFFNRISEQKRKFTYKQNHFTFKYTGFWYQDPENISYRYQLKGFDLDWNQANANRSITYSNLPPGEYSFIVEVTNGSGKWYGNSAAQYNFIIKKPFWKSPLFIIGFIVLIAFSLFGFIQFRLKSLQRDKIKLEEEVHKRTLEIQLQKKEIEEQRDEIEAQRDEVTQQRDRIFLQNKGITDSIVYAKQIQDALLPPLEINNTYLKQLFVVNRPRNIVSGDFHFIEEITPEKVVVAVADCTGHGVPGAFMSVLGVSLLKEIITKTKPEKLNAGNILTELREKVKSSLRQTGKLREAKDGMDIALCIIDFAEMKLQYAGAYNPLYLLRNDELMITKANMMPIGIQFNETPYFDSHSLDLKKDDCIYLFSDGYMDQFGGPNNSKYKASRFKDLIVKIGNQSMTVQSQLMEKEITDWMGTYNQIDDILVMGIRI